MHCELYTWGFSSAGRAPALQAGGQRFDPVNLHQWTKSAVNSRVKFDVTVKLKHAETTADEFATKSVAIRQQE